MKIVLLLFVLSNFPLILRTCPNPSTTSDGTKPLYLLALVAGYPQAETSLLAARIAQEEINNHSDILPDYRIELIRDTIEVCSSSEAGIGLSKLVKHVVYPSCRPVLSIMGLDCSSQTTQISQLAGHQGMDMIQLSRANLDTESQHFPHLWRFIGSSSAYSEAVLAIMKQLNWTRIGIVYNIESSLFSGLAKHLELKMRSSNMTVSFNLGIRGTKPYYLDALASNIRSKETSVIVKMVSLRQSRSLLSFACRYGFTHPHYSWLHVATHPFWLSLTAGEGLINECALGNIFLFIRLAPDDTSIRLVSNKTFSEYTANFRALYRREQPIVTSRFIVVETHYYDQVWAMALAVNSSLSELKSRNLSIDNYTIGQPEITAVIEKNLKNLRFQGASGWIEFNQDQGVPSPIDIFLLPSNTTGVKRVGLYNPRLPSDFYFDSYLTKFPTENLTRIYEHVVMPLKVAIVLYILTGIIIIFTTIQFVIYFCYRHHKVIKATSPVLSRLMFLGCYLLCLAAGHLITFSSFVIIPIKSTRMVIVNFVLVINGINLILITLFVEQLRIYRIFTCWAKQPGKLWSSLSLYLAIFLIATIPNIFLAVFIPLKPPTVDTYFLKSFIDNLPVIEVHTRIEPTSIYTFIGLAALDTVVFLIPVIVMGVRNRKIKMKNFNISGPIYLFLAVLVIAIFLFTSLVIIFLMNGMEPLANGTMVSLLLIFVLACQFIFFLPKILAALFNNKFPRAQSCLDKTLSSVAQVIFS